MCNEAELATNFLTIYLYFRDTGPVRSEGSGCKASEEISSDLLNIKWIIVLYVEYTLFALDIF